MGHTDGRIPISPAGRASCLATPSSTCLGRRRLTRRQALALALTCVGGGTHLHSLALPRHHVQAAGAITFAPAQNFNLGDAFVGLATADFNGDGKLDIVIADYGDVGVGMNVRVLRNTSTSGTISFAAAQSFAVGIGPYAVAVGDFNGDGKPDVVTANYGDNSTGNGTTVSILRNTSVGGVISFAPKQDFLVGIGPASVAVRDVDGDGKLDIVTANFNAGAGTTVSVLQNTSVGSTISFAPKQDFTVGAGPGSVAVQDINGDGKFDVITANQIGNTVSVLRNTSVGGTISFAPKQDFAVGGFPSAVQIADFDGDGKLDIITANFLDNSVSMLRNTGTSGAVSFGRAQSFSVGNNPEALAVADLDGDGKPDLVIADDTAPGMVIVLQNTSTSGAISFALAQNISAGSRPYGVALADLDGDGKPDLIVASYSTPGILTVLRNTTGAIAPLILGPTTLPAPVIGAPYSHTITASGGTSPYTYVVVSGALPPGLTLAATTGVLNGTPAMAGSYTFAVTATDSTGNTGSQQYTLVIVVPNATPQPAPTRPAMGNPIAAPPIHTPATPAGSAPVPLPQPVRR